MTDVLPLPAASVLVLRESPLEVLMIRRHERSSFVPNAWVFPGGMVDDEDRELAADGSELAVMRVTAVRELFEEAGLWLGAPLQDAEAKRRDLLAGARPFRELLAESPVDMNGLVWTSHWITPVGVPKRFDTWFFLARAPRQAIATVEYAEAVEVVWITPEDALARHEAGKFDMVFPTIKNLEAIRGFRTATELIDSRRNAVIEAVLPRIVTESGTKKIVLP